MSGPKADLFTVLEAAARNEGFPLVGAVDLDQAFSTGAIQPHIALYDRWIAEGHAGAMEYLVRGRDRRADPRLVFPEARSILSVAIPYHRRHAGAANSGQGPRYARYLQGLSGALEPGRDYHDEMVSRLERTLAKAAEAFRDNDTPLKWKVCVDTSAVLERSWAALAGLGWIGKNTLLIHPKLGSYLFIGTALLNQETGRGPSPLPSYCGNCRRCLDACPTKAIAQIDHQSARASQVHSNRCISYWTLEKRGELPITPEQKAAMGPWIAGCDLCQEVCPFNIKPVRQEQEPNGGGVSPETREHDATRLQDWLSLLEEAPEAYRARTRDSALNRVKPAQFVRNLAIALGNSWEQLRLTLSPQELARLREAVEQRLTRESDPVATMELQNCLARF